MKTNLLFSKIFVGITKFILNILNIIKNKNNIKWCFALLLAYSVFFTNNVKSQSIPYSCDFSSTTGWTSMIDPGTCNDNWYTNASTNAGGASPEAYCYYDNCNPGTTRLISPGINTSGQTSLNLSFKHFYDGYSTGVTIKIQSSANGTTWTDETWSATTSGNLGPATVNTTITSNVGATTYIAWVITGNLFNYDNWYIDDVSVTGGGGGNPSITLADNGTQVTAATVPKGTLNHVLHKSKLTVSTANATLTGMTCTTTGTCANTTDITNIKVRYSTDNVLDAGDATLSTITPADPTAALTFTPFTSQVITTASPGYIFITADIGASAVDNRTIAVSALTSGNFTISETETWTGSTAAGGTQTIVAVSPVNDNCAGAIPLAVYSGSCGGATTGNVTAATQSIAAISCAGYTGNANDDIWYTFTTTNAGNHTITVDGNGDFDAVVDLRTGACNGSNVSCADGTTEGGVETINYNCSASTTYLVRVYDYGSDFPATTTFTICVIDPTPTNDNCSGAIELTVYGTSCGGATTGNVALATQSQAGCTGTANDDLWYQFTATATAHNITVTSSANFDAVAQLFSGACGSLTSVSCMNITGTGETEGATALTVYGANCGGSTTGDVIGATQSQAGCTGTANDDIWYQFTATATFHNISVAGSVNFDAVVQLFSGACGSLTSITCRNNTFAGETEIINATGLTSGNTYYVRVYDYYSGMPATTTFDICVTGPPANDNCAGATALTVYGANCGGSTTGDVIGATQSQAGCTGTANDDIWFKFTATGTTHEITVVGSVSFNAVVQLFSGACGTLTSITCRNNTGMGGAEGINATGLTNGNIYYVRVYDYGSGTPATTTFTICVTTPCATAGTWDGTEDNNWNTPGNWSCDAVPTPLTNVTIPSGTPFSPNVTNANAFFFFFTINSSATLTVSASSGYYLEVDGNLNNSGTFNHTGDAWIYLRGTGKTIGGTGRFDHLGINFYDGCNYTLTSNLNIYDFVINYTNASNYGTLNIGSYSLTVNGSIHQDGVINCNTGTFIDKALFDQAFDMSIFYNNSGTFIWDLTGTSSNGSFNLQDDDFYSVRLACDPGYTISLSNITDLTMANQFIIDPNTNVSDNTIPIYIKGDWINNGSFSATSSGTVTFTGTNAQSIGGNSTTTFNNLIILNTSP
ncbi:MAG: hypothetical protein HY738_11700 [Bacteroidia bacterium]|nr:hypothetical protein [Bacteroidia bacterium]